MGIGKKRTIRLSWGVVVTGLVAGCAGSSGARSTTTMGAATSAEASELTTQVSTDSAPATTSPSSTTIAADSPIAIEDTLARPNGGESGGFLLVNDTEPSPVDGTAIPARPDAACGFSYDIFGEYPYGDLDLMGCEFDSEASASAYFESWQTAFAEPSPTFYGQSAEAAPLDAVPDWLGRTMSVEPRNEYEERFVRVDLVRRFGQRVYVISSSKPTADPDEVVSQAVAIAPLQAEMIVSNRIEERQGRGREDEANRIGIRYLTPSWAEMTTLGTDDMGGPPIESYSGSNVPASSESARGSYERGLESSGVDETNSLSFVSASIEIHPNVAAARVHMLERYAVFCPASIQPAAGATHGVSCEGLRSRGGGGTSISQNGRLTTLLRTTGGGEGVRERLDAMTVAWERRLADYGFPMGVGEVDDPAFDDNESILRAFFQPVEAVAASSPVDPSTLGVGEPGSSSPAGATTEWSHTIDDFNGPPIDWQLVRFESENAATGYRESVSAGVNLTPFTGPEGAAEVVGGFDGAAGVIVMQDGVWVQRFSSPGRQKWGQAAGAGEEAPIDGYANWAAAYLRSANLK